MAYLVHHTLNRNGIYIGGKPNRVHFDKKSFTDTPQCNKNSEDKKSTLFSIQNQWKKVRFWVSNTRGNQQVRILVGYVPFLTKKVAWWLFLKIYFSNYERCIITCFIFALFRLFTILCFLKKWYQTDWSVRTLDQYICMKCSSLRFRKQFEI